MVISAAALKAMMAAGASAEMLVAAVEAEEGADKQRALEEATRHRDELIAKRAAARGRKKLQRLRENTSSPSAPVQREIPGNLRNPVTRDAPVVTDVTRDIAPPPFPLSSPPTPPLTIPLTPLDDVDGRARDFSELAGRLAAQAMDILGVDRLDRPRLWHGFEEDLERKLADRGWRADLVLSAARRVAASFAKRTGERHPESFGYLTKPIEREHERYEREFAMMGQVKGADPAAVEAARDAQLWLHRDDERFKAWDAHLVATRGRGLPTDSTGGWRVTSEWPPGHPRGQTEAA